MNVKSVLNGENVTILNVTGNSRDKSIVYLDSNNNLKVTSSPMDWTRVSVVDGSGDSTVVESNKTIINEPLRIATFGDSTADTGNFGSSAVCDIEKQYSPFPLSGYIDMSLSQSIATLQYWIPCIFVANGGIGGNTVQNMIDRSKNVWSVGRKSCQDIAAKNPDIVLFHGASINDIKTFTSATAQSAIDAVIDKHTQLVKYFTSQGIEVLDSGCLGYSIAEPNLSFICSKIIYVNSRFKELSKYDDLWTFIDPSGITHDGTGLYIQTRTDDGLHLNSLGGFYLGQAENAKVVSKYKFIGRSGDILWDQQMDYVNATGNNPTNCYLNYDSSKSYILSQTCNASEFIVTVSANSLDTLRLTLSAPPSNSLAKVKANDALRLECDFSITDMSGNLLYGYGATLRINLLSANDNLSGPSLIYDRYHGCNTNQRFFRQFSTPVDSAQLGAYNTQIYAGPKYPAGTWVIKFRPWRVIRYNVKNSLPIT